MTREELEAIEAREKAATPGPWKKASLSEDYGAGYGMTTFFVKQPDGNLYRIGSADTSKKYIEENNNAEFVAHSRQDVPALVAEVKRLNAEVERLTKERDAAVIDLEEIAIDATSEERDNPVCKYCTRLYEDGYPEACRSGFVICRFEWRGVRE